MLGNMATSHKARFTNGVLLPPDHPEDLREGDEVVYFKSGETPSPTLERRDPARAARALEETAGSWADLIDCDKLIHDIYESHLINTRPKPEL